MSDLDIIRADVRVYIQSTFAMSVLSENIGVKAHQLERFLLRGEELPSDAMRKLLGELFHGAKSWDEATQTMADVEKPVTAMPNSSQFRTGPSTLGF